MPGAPREPSHRRRAASDHPACAWSLPPTNHRPRSGRNFPLDDLVSAEAETLNSASVLAAWSKAIERRSADPGGAITAARTLLESVCKTILDDMDETYGPGDDLPKLYRTVSKALKLAPTDYTDEQLRRILGGATTVVEGLGSLRNREGDAHGRGRSSLELCVDVGLTDSRKAGRNARGRYRTPRRPEHREGVIRFDYEDFVAALRALA
jgi:hypothetical protein